jgi:O-antigen ligase
MRLPTRLPTLAENNKAFALGFGALPAVAGSVVSVMLAACFAWALVSLAMKRFAPVLLRGDWLVILPGWLYVAVMIATMLVAGGGSAFIMRDVKYFVPLLPFLAHWAVIARFRAAPGIDYFALFVRAAPIGVILALPLALIQVLVFDDRATGGAGNAFPFAMIAATLGPIALLNLTTPERRWRRIAVSGALAAIICIVLSQTRTVWIAGAVNFLVVGAMVLLAGRRSLRPSRRAAALGLAAALALTAFSYPFVADRVGSLVADIQATIDGRTASDSLADRLAVWDIAGRAVAEAPLTGHGRQVRQLVMNEIAPADYRAVREALARDDQSMLHYPYSHFHNGYLTAAVDAGLIGLVATLLLLVSPLALALLSPADGRRVWRVAAAFALVNTYALTGLFNLMFGHDLIDAFFVIVTIMIALGVVSHEAA